VEDRSDWVPEYDKLYQDEIGHTEDRKGLLLKLVLLHINFFIVCMLGSFFGLACVFPRFGEGWFRRIEEPAARFARKKRAVVVSMALGTVLLRVALLGVMPVPMPYYHDEFSYLLAGDTFAHGRLANPPHPMWLFLETMHESMQPTYASKYPPAQGGVLALGELLGNPWIGVLVSMGAMVAAVTWALQGWLPPRWALLGGVLVVLRIGVVSYWMNSYWGGAVAASGGALVIGAVPRIWKRPRVVDALLMGLGAALLANSRPFEGLFFCLPVAVAMGWWIYKLGPRRATAFRRVILPLAAVLVATAGFLGYYNWRVTGNALLHPQSLDMKTYTNGTLFLWEKLPPPRHYNNLQMDYFYNVYEKVPFPVTYLLRRKTQQFWMFFLGSALSVPLLAFFWVMRERRMRLLLAQFAILGLELLAFFVFYPHYAAPLTATVFILLMEAMRHLRLWEVLGRPLGLMLCRMVVLLTVVRVPFVAVNDFMNPDPIFDAVTVADRVRVTRQLDAMPGKQLVLVRYAMVHAPNNEWVYNRADIDGSKIVWTRDIPGQDLGPLFEYYRDRTVWVVDADASVMRLQPYVGSNLLE
jgi:hypothetical protein